jgi:phosphoribosylaminoimidazolecarboxamide formyltransferase/IMP cyclohydrolase
LPSPARAGHQAAVHRRHRQLLADKGLPVTEVAEVTQFPEMLDGRVKTLHPKVHGGLLARRELPAHMAALKEHGIDTIDLLVVNLYPFEATVAKAGCTLADAIENIDIGGPAMVRSAAKNWKDVGVITAADQYEAVLAELKAGGKLSDKLRFACRWPRSTASPSTTAPSATTSRPSRSKKKSCRKPTCPAHPVPRPEQRHLHQGARPALRRKQPPAGRAVPRPAPRARLAGHRRAAAGQGALYNNIADADAAWECVKSFDAAACVIVKHANPCGVAVGSMR